MLSFTTCPDVSGKSHLSGKKIDYWKYCLIIVSVFLFPTASGTGQTYITGGDVSGTWTSAGSPY